VIRAASKELHGPALLASRGAGGRRPRARADQFFKQLAERFQVALKRPRKLLIKNN
jgi:hypothetical protein